MKTEEFLHGHTRKTQTKLLAVAIEELARVRHENPWCTLQAIQTAVTFLQPVLSPSSLPPTQKMKNECDTFRRSMVDIRDA